MSTFKCKMCGGALEINNNETVATCEYCGTTQTLPKIDDEKRANLYDRANHFRRNNEFDKAMGIYEQILNEDSSDAEAYWSLVLCRYGIEYVEDPTSHKRVPTVNRAQFTSVFDDDNYKSALQYADGYQKSIYDKEANTINEIQKGILAISQKEEPFDVFICYKETDNQGRRTPDSVLANELYHQLTNEGFKVFFAAITLEDKLGTAYEPYIFAALNSAKVMVVLGTKPEYFNAVWVKNEWSRYLALVKNSGGKKMLIPAYKDMDPYDLPEEFSHLQAQDMSKLGFMQDLLRGIKKIVFNTKNNTDAVADPVTTVNIDTSGLMKRAFISLEDGDWKEAENQAEKVLDINPECAEAYLIKLLVDIKVKNKDEIKNSKILFDDNPNYLKTIRFADNSLKSFLLKSAKENIYTQAKELLNSENIEEVIKAKEIFESFSDYENSQVYAARCFEKIQDAKQNQKKQKKIIAIAIVSPLLIIGIILYSIFIPPLLEYNRAIANYKRGNYKVAYDYFSDSTYKDSGEMALKCQYEYVQANYDNGNELTYNYLRELKAQNYKDSVQLYKELYAWNIELNCCNTDANDYDTKLSNIPKETEYLHMQFILTGGEPGKSVTIYHSIKWPDRNERTSDWYWEECLNGSALGFEYTGGVSTFSGMCTIKFYNAEDDSFIGRITIPVGN